MRAGGGAFRVEELIAGLAAAIAPTPAAVPAAALAWSPNGEVGVGLVAATFLSSKGETFECEVPGGTAAGAVPEAPPFSDISTAVAVAVDPRAPDFSSGATALALFFFRQRKKATPARPKTNTITTTAIPALAPPERPLFESPSFTAATEEISVAEEVGLESCSEVCDVSREELEAEEDEAIHN